MTKKRRMFDIDVPDEAALDQPLDTPTVTARRGPMAAAIGETGGTLRERADVETAIRLENDALAHEFVRLKKLGLITDLIPIDLIQSTKLIRDRSRRLDPELDDLCTSLLAVGLSNPIQVEPDAAGGGYELVQGWRRLSAYQALYAQTGDDRWARIPASLVPMGQTIEGLYRRMVDENLVRKDISWIEMARLARSFAEDQGAGAMDVDGAVNHLFASANPQKRSYIRRFAFLLDHLEKVLDHPESIPRALGLQLAHRIEVDPGAARDLSARLRGAPGRDAAAEVDILRRYAEVPLAISPRGNAVRGRPAKRGKTTLRLPVPGGEVKCTAFAGRIELASHHDFSALSRGRLETAIEAFFAALKDPA